VRRRRTGGRNRVRPASDRRARLAQRPTPIDGKYLPPPPPKFGGVINLQAAQSKPYWPAQVVPPKGAPNILLIMTDDQGFGVSGTFGGVIPTPAMDRVAKAGLRYTHSTPPRCARRQGRH
jgi:hypothetical protein